MVLYVAPFYSDEKKEELEETQKDSGMGAEGGKITVTEHFGYSMVVHLKKEK